MKSFFYLVLCMTLLGSCEKDPVLTDMDQEQNSNKPQETWRMILSFQDQSFDLLSYDVHWLVGSSEGLTYDPVIGRSVYFKDDLKKFSCEILYEFSNDSTNWGLGKFRGTDFSIRGLMKNPKITFCKGEQNISVIFKLEKIK